MIMRAWGSVDVIVAAAKSTTEARSTTETWNTKHRVSCVCGFTTSRRKTIWKVLWRHRLWRSVARESGRIRENPDPRLKRRSRGWHLGGDHKQQSARTRPCTQMNNENSSRRKADALSQQQYFDSELAREDAAPIRWQRDHDGHARRRCTHCGSA